MRKNEINYIMDKCIDYYRKASIENNIFLVERIQYISAGNALKKVVEEFLDNQPKKQEYEKYMIIVKYFQTLNY